MSGAGERLVTAVPGPRSRELAALLARYEAQGVTYLGPEFPVFWESADGALVTDVDGNRYLDLTGAFAVAAIGHTNAHVAAAIGAQAQRLVHGMGDVHPAAGKARLLERLAALAPGDLQKTYLATGGAEAIEFALKTAVLATGKSHFLAFGGAYHGLSLGALDVVGIEKFRAPFAALVGERTTYLPFPGPQADLAQALGAVEAALAADAAIGAVVLEPVQGRGGVIIPPAGFLRGIRAICDARGTVLVLDEIYTGFGRTGTRFACEREAVVPDLLCIGKALGGGFPIAATIGRPAIIDAWPVSSGEALHTSTFLGNPLACAAALAALDEMDRLDMVTLARAGEESLRALLAPLRAAPGVTDVRGIGMLWAIEFDDAMRANRVVVDALARGLIVLQSGPTGTSITLAPPLTIERGQLERAVALLTDAVAAVAA